MARATETQIRAIIAAYIWMFENARKYGHANTENLIENQEAALATLVAGSSPRTTAAANAARAVRAQFAGMVSPGAVRSILDPLWIEYAEIQGYRVTDAVDALVRLRQDFVDNSQSVNAREFTYGSASAGGSNVGDGSLLRVTVDKDAEPLEAGHTETKTFECVADEHSGAQEHAESFEVRGEPSEIDDILVDGSGVLLRNGLTTINARTGRLQNASFESFAGSVSSLTDLPGWTATSALSNYQLSTTTYRGYPGEPATLYSLRIDANDTLSQNLNVQRMQINPNVPYVCQLAYNRQTGLGDGTLTLRLGSQTTSVALAAQTGWNILRLPLDENLFLQNWNQEDPTVAVQLASRTTGYVLVDDVIFAPMVPVDGTFWGMVGGSTPFLRDDIFTVTDTADDTAIIQRWIARGYNAYLPSDATTSETWSDPS